VQFLSPDDGRKNRLKHVDYLKEINKLRNVASCLLYSANIRVLAMHGPMNVKRINVKPTPCCIPEQRSPHFVVLSVVPGQALGNSPQMVRES